MNHPIYSSLGLSLLHTKCCLVRLELGSQIKEKEKELMTLLSEIVHLRLNVVSVIISTRVFSRGDLEDIKDEF